MRRLFATGGKSGGTPAPGAVNSPITMTYVAPNGNDGTGLRGRIDYPFLTINAALAAVQSGDLLWIAPQGAAPGYYAENVVVPATLTSLTIAGPGAVISPATGIGLTYTPSGARGDLTVQDIAIRTRDGDPGMNAVDVDGGLTATVAVFKDVAIGKSNFAAADAAVFENVACTERPRFVNCTDATFRSCTIAGTLPLQVLFNPGGRPQGTVTIKASSLYGGLELIGQPVIICDQATRIEAPARAPAIDGTALTISAATAPSITVQGTVKGGATNIVFAPVVGIANSRADFTGADFSDAVSVSCSAVSGTPATVNANGTTFRSTLTVGESVAVEATNATILGPLVGAGTGAINRPVPVPATAAVAGVGNVACTISPPMLDTNYAVLGQSDNTGFPAWAIVNKTVSGFDISPVAALQTAPGNLIYTIQRGV